MSYVDTSKYLNLSRDLVKIAVQENKIENYRIYSHLRQVNISRGEFKLSYLAELLYPDATKSNLKKHINNLRCLLNKDTTFFQHIQGEKYRIISQKKILIKYKGNAETWNYHFPLCTVLTRQAFRDIIIAIYMGGEMSNKKAAKVFNCTERRIQQATRRNNEARLFIKHIRRAIEPFPTFSKAKKMQAELKDIGIITSNPFDYKGGQAISVNRTNKYTSGVSRRFKGKIRKRTHATQKKREQWFKPAFRGKGSRDTRLYYENRYDCKFYEFNEKNYTFQKFINEHAAN